MLYETEEDRKKERDLLASYCEQKGLAFSQTTVGSRQDAIIHFAVAEAKNRYWKRPYKSLIIDKEKLVSLVTRAEKMSLPAILIVHITVEGGEKMRLALTITRRMIESFETKLGGRMDRDDPNDIEEVCVIPITRFERW